MDVAKRVGAKVRELRKAQGLSQEELADRAGAHRTFVSQIERASKNVTLKSAAKVAKGLNIRLSELLAQAGL